MSITNDGLLQVMSGKLAYLSQKQAVLAENVANADTPGYKAKDVQAFSFSDALQQTKASGMAVTDPGHIIPASMAGVNAKTFRMKSNETLPSGNSVDLEQQAMMVSETAIDYQAVTAMYKKVTSWFKLALGRNAAG